ncbi:peptide/nickel transport system substrate-binding protein [Leucobacter exalbidus]|uniref:Peptide/nickel transport system substrate-binding protein n=1 Tax=Leucobacter exalbidus TaxID=662960 RepID=A0A940PTQ6_9MICO|nr:ABC transporter substrate-binding protein [Leucobacter exalbidus]MBP1326638.1 peptide/nickel transport system substrate-binding protein [Leucobacter exalbidus]
MPSLKKHFFTAAGVIAVSAIALTGCAGSSGGSGATGADATINIGSLYEPVNLSNTAGGGQGVTEALTGNVYESLSKLNDDGTISPMLATDHEVSEDGLTYTYKLREDVSFQSGKQLTSADVKASIEAVLAPDSQSARKGSLEVITGIETPDDYTVVLTLSQPSISLHYLLSYIWIVNADATDIEKEADGTGPYTLGQWKRGSTLTLERWDDYWGEPASNKQVVFNYFTDATAEDTALSSGRVDLITSVQNPDSLAQFESGDKFTISEGQSTTKELLAFNDRVAPFDDAKVRQAVYSAVDREKLLNAIWGDYGTLIGSMVPPSDPWYEDLNDLNPYDVDRSKKLLAEAGLEDGFSFTLDTPSYDPHPAVAELLQSELKKVGIEVKINTISADEWYTKVFKERDFEATLQEHVNDRDVVWYGNPDFYWGYDNAEVTEWVSRAEQAPTEAEQTELLKKANKQIATDAASVWLYLYPQIVVASTDVEGYPINGLNSQFFAYDIVKN